MKSTLFFAIVLSVLLYSCGKGYGTAYIRNNLTIYYTKENDLNIAKKLADYWIAHKLIIKKPQTLRFLNTDSVCQLQLIKSSNSNVESLNFYVIKDMQILEDELNRTVFSRGKIDIVICDSRFNVINDLNY
jgi:hypothetical protein